MFASGYVNTACVIVRVHILWPGWTVGGPIPNVESAGFLTGTPSLYVLHQSGWRSKPWAIRFGGLGWKFVALVSDIEADQFVCCRAINAIGTRLRYHCCLAYLDTGECYTVHFQSLLRRIAVRHIWEQGCRMNAIGTSFLRHRSWYKIRTPTRDSNHRSQQLLNSREHN